MTDDLGDRMKRYEDSFRTYLPPRQPVIIRVDGKAFHTFTKCCEKPFDKWIGGAIDAAAYNLMRVVQNARLAYVQSDEVSLLLIDYNSYQSQQWFDGNLQKVVSVSAAVAAVNFTESWVSYNPYGSKALAYFDARAFIVPEREVCNYFIWRQQDATRNAVQMVARAHFSHRECLDLSCDQLQEKLFREKGLNFNDIEPYWKRGRVVDREGNVDRNIPIFTQDRAFVEKYLKIEQE